MGSLFIGRATEIKKLNKLFFSLTVHAVIVPRTKKIGVLHHKFLKRCFTWPIGLLAFEYF